MTCLLILNEEAYKLEFKSKGDKKTWYKRKSFLLVC